MYILNTTFHVHKSVDSEFKKWVRTEYIPSAINPRKLTQAGFARLMLEVQEDCSSYAISLKATSLEDAVDWYDNSGAELRRELYARFGEKVVFFTTCMEELPLN